MQRINAYWLQTLTFAGFLTAAVFSEVVMGQTITASIQSCQRGTAVSFTAKLSTDGSSVAGTQNTITFDSINTPIAVKPGGGPNCTANAALQKFGYFSFLPTGCSGTACTQVRAILAGSYSTLIPDGSVLYTCVANVSNTASAGDYPLSVDGLFLTDANEKELPGAVGLDGEIDVLPSIGLTSATGHRGGQASISAVLSQAGTGVNAIQNDITFDSINTPLALKTGGGPNCTVNGAIQKEASAFAIEPIGCTGTACTGLRAIIYSLSNTAAPIPDGATLYTCVFNVASNASLGAYPVTVSRAAASVPRTGMGSNDFTPLMTNGSITVVP